ncbi:D-arabinose dehydrogenase [Spathaspora passalidarum NRRL Y-27907]|uniref:2-dehydropantolactone reductase n=1 Tax=Spathaspora passalidarum (strain NRRL Y-27907 / 11-Y1) TaxID=619300 RepID=G3AKE3_SPAPN|nr:D-arabinose dehydrogenase [Spathaspora passalidarum NRRL Y-27907]EGW32900.1 D-arabinose dehydrogenase [Spathaspora passalidarum NRRL Y-27907]
MQLATKVDLKLSNGKSIPALGLGTVPPEDPSELKQQVITAIKAGYRHIDTAWYYGTEKYIGQALKELFDEGVIKREDLFVTTKVWPSFWHSPEKSLDKSLEDLGLDYVDLFMQHWPVALHGDENGLPPAPKHDDGSLWYDDDPVTGTKFIETYHKMEDIIDKTSKVKSIGVSNYSIPKLKQLLPKVRKYAPVVNQIELHPQLPQLELVDYCKSKGIVVVAYSPVGSNGAPVLKVPLIQELAKKYDVTTNEITNAYHVLNGRGVLPRSSNLERIKTIIRLPQLSEDDLKKLDQVGLQNPKRYICDSWGYGLGFRYWEGDTLSTEFD